MQALPRAWGAVMAREACMVALGRASTPAVGRACAAVTKPTAEMTIAMIDAQVGGACSVPASPLGPAVGCLAAHVALVAPCFHSCRMLLCCPWPGPSADDVYGEDPTVNKLQALAAQQLGKEAALFVPSGTMGNLIAVGGWVGGWVGGAHTLTRPEQTGAVHGHVVGIAPFAPSPHPCRLPLCRAVPCRGAAAQAPRGSELLVGDEQHLFVYEQSGVSQLFGVAFHTLPNKADGTFDIEGRKHSLLAAIESRHGGADPHYSKPAVVAIENTHNRCGGAVLPLAWIDDVTATAREHGLAVHMDGARLMNAVAASGTSAERLVRDCDTVSLCLSKGLGAPVGSVIAGSKAFVATARRLRKVLGGGMRQAGVLAAPGIVGLKEHAKLLAKDHARAKSIARGIAGLHGVVIDAKRVASNIVFFDLDAGKLSVEAYAARRAAAAAAAGAPAAAGGASDYPDVVPPGTPLADAFARLMEAYGRVKLGSYGTSRLRAVTHHQITDDDVDTFIEAASKAVEALAK